MTREPTSPGPPTLRMTTGTLMVWVVAVAVALSLVKGDTAERLPPGPIPALVAMVLVVVPATVFGIPWLSYRLSQSPEAQRPQSALSERYEQLFVVGLLGWITAAVLVLGLLAVMIYQT